MEYDVTVNDEIFIVKNVNLKKALEIKSEFETSFNKYRNYLLYKDIIGYYAGWDCINHKSIYCGTRSESTSLKQIKEYAKNVG